MGQPEDAVGTVMGDAPVAIQRDQTAMSAAVSEMEGRPEARGHDAVCHWIGVAIAGWGGARDQFGIHEVVHILTVLAVLPGEAFLNGPCGREVRDTAFPRNRNNWRW